MNIFSRLFGGSRKKSGVNMQSSPHDSSIKYSPELIEKLQDDHQKLFDLYGAMDRMAEQDSFVDISKVLRKFRMELQGHLLVENVHFYVYVENKFRLFPDEIAFIKDVRMEMNRIARTVVKFTKKYDRDDFTEELKQNFVKELHEIGGILTSRVEMEENRLYTLYTGRS